MTETSAPNEAKVDSSEDVDRIIKASTFRFGVTEWDEIRRMLYCAWDAGYVGHRIEATVAERAKV